VAAKVRYRGPVQMDLLTRAGERRVTVVLRAFTFWTLLVLFFAGQDYVLGDGSVSWALALKWEVPRWYVWGLLAPVIVATDRAIGGGRPLGLRLALQVPLGVAWTLVAIAIGLLLCSSGRSSAPIGPPRSGVSCSNASTGTC
jgi:hypothetical protein